MAEIQDVGIRNFGAGSDSLDQYRTPHGPAIAAFVAGLISVIGIVPWDALMVVPIVAIVLSIYSLFKIRSLSDSGPLPWYARMGFFSALVCIVCVVGIIFMDNSIWKYGVIFGSAITALYGIYSVSRLPLSLAVGVSGERVAKIGLTLGLVFLVANAINFHVPREQLKQASITYGRQWLLLLNQGKTFDAFVQKLTPESRPPEGLHRETVERGNRAIRDGVIELEQDGITKNLQRFRPEETKVRFDSIEDTTFKGKIVEAQVVYKVTVEQRGSYHVMLQMVADRNPRSGYQEWRIYDHVAPYERKSKTLPEHHSGHDHDH